MDKGKRSHKEAAIYASQLFWVVAAILTLPYAWFYRLKDWMAEREEEWILKADKDGGPPPVNFYK